MPTEEDLDSQDSELDSNGQRSASSSAYVSPRDSPEAENFYTLAETSEIPEGTIPTIRDLVSFPMSDFLRIVKILPLKHVNATLERSLRPAWEYYVHSGEREKLDNDLWLVGRGGSSCVFGATVEIDNEKSITVAVKILDVSQRKDAALQLEQELKIMQSLKHNHIVTLISAYSEKNLQGFVLYPLAHCNLAEFMQNFPRVRPERAQHSARETLLRAFGCLSSALYYLHDTKSVKHKDIKPENIMIDSHGFVSLGDFGISKQYTSKFQTVTNGPTAFTTKYAAHEVISQSDRGLECDIFSLGCVFLEMATVALGESLRNLDTSIFENQRPGASPTPTYQGSLDRVHKWIQHLKIVRNRLLANESSLGRGHSEDCTIHLPGSTHLDIIFAMMSKEPSYRPSISDVYLEFQSFAEKCPQCTNMQVMRTLGAPLEIALMRGQVNLPRYSNLKTPCPSMPTISNKCQSISKREKLSDEHSYPVNALEKVSLQHVEAGTERIAAKKYGIYIFGALECNRVMDETSSIQSYDSSSASDDYHDQYSSDSLEEMFTRYPAMMQDLVQEISRILQPNTTQSSGSFVSCPSEPTAEGSQTQYSSASGGPPSKRIATGHSGGSSKRPDNNSPNDGSQSEGLLLSQASSSRTPAPTPARPFACPFYKHNPAIHQQCSSCVRGYALIHRLKYAFTSLMV